MCQKGYYPDQLDKANQDSYLVLENILGDESAHLFGFLMDMEQRGICARTLLLTNLATLCARSCRNMVGRRKLLVEATWKKCIPALL